MKGAMKKVIGGALTMLASIVVSAHAGYPTEKEIVCPTITAEDVEDVISNGFISTEQGYTLADEAILTRAQVILNEPSANPFDTYYQMFYQKEVNEENFGIYIGNLLGKTSSEAKDRARKIFGNQKSYDAIYDPQQKICLYKEINPTLGVAGYPFKSAFESAVLIGFPILSDADTANRLKTFRMHKKHKA